MPTYLIQSQWTDQGIRSVKESAKRLDMGKKKLKEMGGEIKAVYLTMGRYDMMAVVDVPTDAVLATYILGLDHKEIFVQRRSRPSPRTSIEGLSMNSGKRPVSRRRPLPEAALFS